MRKIFFCLFLPFFILSTNLNAETISTAVTTSADTDPAGTAKTITEDLTVTSSGSFTCTKISSCITVGASGLTIDNQGTIKINGSAKENTNLFLETSAKKTTENQETFVMNIGFKRVF